MNQGKLKVVKQEMAGVNIDILGINELKWTRMGEFNSNDHYIYYCVIEGKEGKGLDTKTFKTINRPQHHADQCIHSPPKPPPIRNHLF